MSSNLIHVVELRSIWIAYRCVEMYYVHLVVLSSIKNEHHQVKLMVLYSVCGNTSNIGSCSSTYYGC